jgi:hypothetical protein
MFTAVTPPPWKKKGEARRQAGRPALGGSFSCRRTRANKGRRHTQKRTAAVFLGGSFASGFSHTPVT